MIRSLLLFAHIVGMVALFVGLGLELVSLEFLRRSGTRSEASPWIRIYRVLPRLYGIAFGLILLSGIFMAARLGVHQFAWVRVSFLAMLLMGIAGGPLIRSRVLAITRDETPEGVRRHASDRLLRASIDARIALGLAIIYLMISKVGVVDSLLATGLALLAGVMAGFYDGRRPAAETTN